MTMPRTHYSVAEVAKAWGVSADLVYDLIDSGKLRATRFGRVLRIPVAEREAYVERNTA